MLGNLGLGSTVSSPEHPDSSQTPIANICGKVPFNGGPRICIGQQFALTEMGYVLTRLFQRFERVESYMGRVDRGNPTLKAEIVLQPGDGVNVAFFLPESSKD